MNVRSRGLWLAGAVLAGSCLLASPVLAVIFSSFCDRFEVDGNAFGSPGGALDFVDEFDAGTLAPNWSVLLGSAQEAGSAAVFHNPGTPITLGPTLFEISTIENAVHGIEQGAGNFTASSYWSPTLPSIDAEFHMQLYSIAPIIEAAGLTVNNFSPQVATQQGDGSIAGYSVSQSLTHGFGTGFTTVQLNTVPINPASVTGRIVLRMSFDDSTDMLTSSFSLDGGTTFQSPFPPMHIFNGGVIDYDVLLGGSGLNANVPPPPPTAQLLPLRLLLVKSGSAPTSRRVTYQARSPRFSGSTLAGDPTIAGATLNLKLDGTSQCFFMPAAGWSRSGSHGPTFKYTDRNGTYGPVQQARISPRSGGVQNKVLITGANGPVDIVPPNPGIEGDANFHIGNVGGYCASTVGGTIGPNDARTFRAKNAPAPPTCYVNACSPNGAFLDDPHGAF